MRRFSHAIAAASAVIGLATSATLCVPACSSPPGSTVDSASAFEWSVAFGGVDEAVLSVCGGRNGGELLAVGGRAGSGAIFAFAEGEWRAENVPARAGILWWCWVESATGEAWAVGEGGTILRRDAGDTWRWVETAGAVPEKVTLFGIWGAAGDDIHVVGGSLQDPTMAMTMAHHDGRAWSPVDVGALPERTLFKVWGTSAQDVWAVGAGGTAVHHDGAAWTASETGSQARLTAVWGTGPTDVYAVGGLGVGEVLRYDGASWSVFATEAEELAGVYTAPGQPLYVGGNRGLLVRYSLDQGGRPSAANATRHTHFVDIDVHALYRADGALVAAASDLLGGGATGWRGTVLYHGDPSLTGPVIRPSYPDAGAPDSGVTDAGVTDAGVTDAGATDASSQAPGPGEPCGVLPDLCAPGLECWYLQDSAEYLCTQTCGDPSECTDYGAGACCERPGFQTVETVCIPGDRPTCN